MLKSLSCLHLVSGSTVVLVASHDVFFPGFPSRVCNVSELLPRLTF